MKTILAQLESMFPEASKTTLRQMVQRQRVRLHGRMVRSVNEPVPPGAALEVLDTSEAGGGAERGAVLAEGLKLVYVDADLVIVEKPAGLLTSTDAREKRPTAWRILQDYFHRQNHRQRIHLIHRLDREASGLLVFARHWEAYGALKRQFFEHAIARVYDVIVHGVPAPKAATLEDFLLEDDTGVVHVTSDMKKGKLAILDYQVVDESAHKAHLRCTLHTGRRHQIRVQLAARGHPVCGDPVYGKTTPSLSPKHQTAPPKIKPVAPQNTARLALHAARLSLTHPRTGKIMTFQSPAPPGFRKWLQD